MFSTIFASPENTTSVTDLHSKGREYEMLLFIHRAAIMHDTISLEFYIYNFCFPYLQVY